MAAMGLVFSYGERKRKSGRGETKFGNIVRIVYFI
jgi:hypothetical protein